MKRQLTPGGPFENVSNLLPEQLLIIYAQIEDYMFVQGLHRDRVLDLICQEYGCVRTTAKSWIQEMRRRWLESIDEEDLAVRHYQLDRMAHHLYSEAMTGLSWGKAKESLDSVIRHLKNGRTDEALALLEDMRNSKVPDLRVAQKVLWNLCAVSGYGNKVTVDVSGAGVSVGPPATR